MAKKGDKYILSPAEEQLLNDPKAGNVVKSGGAVNLDSLPMDLQRRLAAHLEENGVKNPEGNNISFTRDVLGQINSPANLDGIAQRLAPTAGTPIIPNGSVLPAPVLPPKVAQNDLFAGGKNAADVREGSPMLNDLTSMLNNLNNQYIRPTIRNHPILGPIESVLSTLNDFRNGQVGDLETKGVGPINARNISNTVKGVKNAVGGKTGEQSVVEELKKRFPGVDIQDEISRAKQGNKQNVVAAQEGRTATGKRWRIEPDGTIKIIG